MLIFNDKCKTILPRSNDNLHYIQDNLSNWLKGFIDSSTISKVTRFTESRSLTTTLILKLVVKLQSLFRSDIWSRRCSSQKDKQSRLGINISSLIKANNNNNKPNYTTHFSKSTTDTYSM